MQRPSPLTIASTHTVKLAAHEELSYFIKKYPIRPLYSVKMMIVAALLRFLSALQHSFHGLPANASDLSRHRFFQASATLLSTQQTFLVISHSFSLPHTLLASCVCSCYGTSNNGPPPHENEGNLTARSNPNYINPTTRSHTGRPTTAIQKADNEVCSRQRSQSCPCTCVLYCD